MSKLEMVRSLFEYNEWANERVLEAAIRVDEEELRRKREVSFGSIEGIQYAKTKVGVSIAF